MVVCRQQRQIATGHSFAVNSRSIIVADAGITMTGEWLSSLALAELGNVKRVLGRTHFRMYHALRVSHGIRRSDLIAKPEK